MISPLFDPLITNSMPANFYKSAFKMVQKFRVIYFHRAFLSSKW
ncbi:hypothetical protein I33_1961 [Bacillus subtilis subsp. subtilis str. RO-NN-1]|nr:hypothetical protein I33_1961 [Bacillus subtilis subsp. subtilis str. RO-NN-1]